MWRIGTVPAMQLGPSLQNIARGKLGFLTSSYNPQRLQEDIDRADAT
jgi:NAD kinase